MSHNSNIAEFGTLCPHRAVGTSGKENSMARKRYQNGRVFLKGKKEEKWVGRYREDVVEVTGTTKRVRRSVILGTKRELPTKRLAERRLATILARINCLDYRPGRAATFGEFIERWKTEVLTTQKPSSARAVRSHLNCYIIPEVGKLRLDEFSVENQQRFITRMPERLAVCCGGFDSHRPLQIQFKPQELNHRWRQFRVCVNAVLSTHSSHRESRGATPAGPGFFL